MGKLSNFNQAILDVSRKTQSTGIHDASKGLNCNGMHYISGKLALKDQKLKKKKKK